MKIQGLGHVVIKVRELDSSESFYNGVLGLPIVAHNETPPMTFFSLGNHHDFAIMAVGSDATRADRQSVGLAHVAFCIGNTREQLVDAKLLLDKADIRCTPIDHEVTHSLYFADPDGNQIELYVEASDVWRCEPERVAQSSPLAL